MSRKSKKNVTPQNDYPAVVAPASMEDFLAQQQNQDLLRFITCGSVDDGKSTLIGRLLWESQQLLDDQLSALKSDSKKFGTQGDNIDFALLVDGLAAEREQGITIDVAYRYFSTSRRKFIVADTVKGKGVSYMENSLDWHYKSPDRKQLKEALEEQE